VHVGVKRAFIGHTVKTVFEAGWRSSKDGPLLALAQDQFNVFITIDQNLEHQQNLSKMTIGFVIARVRSNEITYYEPLFERLKEAAETVRAGQIIYVDDPRSKA
jgi:hypothetical protein